MRTLPFVVVLPFLVGCHVHYGVDPSIGVVVAEPQVREQLKICAAQIAVLEANLANKKTVAFKRQLDEVHATQGTLRLTEASLDMELEVIVDHPILQLRRDFKQGALESTGRELDVAIMGRGFFQVTLADGSTGYTRDGRLRIDRNGKLTDARGRIITPEITLPDDVLEFRIGANGRVTGRTASAPDATTNFGQMSLAKFMSEEGLIAELGVFRASEASGSAITENPGDAGIGRLKQAFLERSNVNVTMTRLRLGELRREYRTLEQRLAH